MPSIFSKTRIASLLFASSFSMLSFAAEQADSKVQDVLSQKMQALNIPAESIKPSAMKGLYEVVAAGEVYYISEDGKYLVYGSLYDIDKKMLNLTKQTQLELSKAKVAANIGKIKAFEKDMIEYKAKDEKYVVTVFTDPTCGYCQKLHSEMADYNKNGITIRYLAFPRGGVKSPTYKKMVSIWCADDPQQAMTAAKRRQAVASKECKNTVKEQYELGLLLGVNGTPAMILDDGSMQPGYLPADRLLKVLEKK